MKLWWSLKWVMGSIWIVACFQIIYTTLKECFPTLFRWLRCLWLSSPLPPCPMAVPLTIPFSSSIGSALFQMFCFSATFFHHPPSFPRLWLLHFFFLAVSRCAFKSLVRSLLQFSSLCSALCLTSFVPQKGWFLIDLKFSQNTCFKSEATSD